MEISKRQLADVLEVHVKGRLDSYWADHLGSALEEVVHEGAHNLRLDLSEVAYVSSGGLRVLVQFYKKLKGIEGSFVVSNPSEAVKKILEIAGLAAMLLGSGEPAPPKAAAEPSATRLDREGVTYEIYDQTPDSSLRCRVIGEPALLEGCRFGEEHGRTLPLTTEGFALGLGAFGSDYEGCRGRFGELLAVAGTAAYLPTDGTNTPDYLVSAGASVPDVTILYGLACDGPFAKLARFETRKETPAISFSRLVDDCLSIADADAAGIVMVAESVGLMGAALRRSPALGGSAEAPFGHPKIREWLSFTPERVHPMSVSLVVGVAAKGGAPALGPMVRPLGNGLQTCGHFHAAAFTYGPLRRGEVNLRETVSRLYETERLQGVLHLLNDDRPIAGVGESEFVRGACWIGPISAAVAEGLK